MPPSLYARVDASSTVLSGATVDFTAPANGGRSSYTGTYTTGDGASSGQMYVVVGAGGGSGQVSFDDVSLTVTPEPMTLGPLAVGAGAWLRRRSA